MKHDLSDRLLAFGASSLRFVSKLNRSDATHHVALQFVRSATSAGANYEEACAAETRADFIHKLQVSLKEIRESLYWLNLARKAELCLESQVDGLLQECTELSKILGKSVATAKNRR